MLFTPNKMMLVTSLIFSSFFFLRKLMPVHFFNETLPTLKFSPNKTPCKARQLPNSRTQDNDYITKSYYLIFAFTE